MERIEMELIKKIQNTQARRMVRNLSDDLLSESNTGRVMISEKNLQDKQTDCASPDRPSPLSEETEESIAFSYPY